MAKAKILLIDDELPLHAIFKGMLHLERYESLTATSAKEAIDLMEERRPDVIFCDLMMPVMSGLEFLMWCQEQPELRDIPIIMITAYGLEDLVDVALAIGAFDVLPKPFTRHGLLEVIEAALARTKQEN